ncbi:MAG: hypothetical protein ACHQC8_02520 [Solirubrobacterales bacterium]
MPTAAVDYGPSLGSENGQSDDTFISIVREKGGDVPKFRNDTIIADGKSGATGAGGLPYQTSNNPVHDDGSFAIRASGTPLTLTSTFPPTGTNVYVNYATGEIFFGTVPVSTVPLSWDYKWVKWRDQEIKDALITGLRALWPSMGKVYKDETINLAPLQWDYPLPAAAQDPWARVIKLRYRTPNISVLPFEDLDEWERIGYDTLHLPHGPDYFPGTLQLSYWGPCQRLADVPVNAMWLPIWYALSTLLPWQETKRIKDDRAVAQNQEGGQAPLLLTQTGEYYYQRFTQELAQMKQVPPGTRQRFVSRYAMRHTHRG